MASWVRGLEGLRHGLISDDGHIDIPTLGISTEDVVLRVADWTGPVGPACSFRLSTRAFERIWRIHRELKTDGHAGADEVIVAEPGRAATTARKTGTVSERSPGSCVGSPASSRDDPRAGVQDQEEEHACSSGGRRE